MATDPADLNARYEVWKRQRTAQAELPPQGGATVNDRYAAWKARKQIFAARQVGSEQDLTGRETQGTGRSLMETLYGAYGQGPETPAAPVPPVAEAPVQRPSPPVDPYKFVLVNGAWVDPRDLAPEVAPPPTAPQQPIPAPTRGTVDEQIAARVQAQAQQHAAAGQPFYPSVVPAAQASENIPTERLANAPGLPTTTGPPIATTLANKPLAFARGLATTPIGVGQQLLGSLGVESPEKVDEAFANAMGGAVPELGAAMKMKIIEMRLSGQVPPEMSVVEYWRRQIKGQTTAPLGTAQARAAWGETAAANTGEAVGQLGTIPLTFLPSVIGPGVQELMRQIGIHPEEAENLAGRGAYARAVLAPGRIAGGLWGALIGMIPALPEFIGLRDRLAQAPDDQTRNALVEDWIATELGTAVGTAIGLTPMAVDQIKSMNKWGKNQREVMRQRRVLAEKLEGAVKTAEPQPPPTVPAPTAIPPERPPMVTPPAEVPPAALPPDVAREARGMTPVDLAPPVTPAITAPRAVTSVSEIDAFPSGPVPPGLTIGGYEITGISRSAKSKPGDPVAFVDIRNPENGIEGVWSRKQIEEELGGPTRGADLAGRNVLEPFHRPIKPHETLHDLEAWKAEMLTTGATQPEVENAVEEALAKGIDPTLSDDLTSLSSHMDALEREGKITPSPEQGPVSPEAPTRAGRRKQAAFQPAVTPPEVTTPPAEVKPAEGEAPEATEARKLRASVDKKVKAEGVTRAKRSGEVRRAPPVHPDTYARTGVPEELIKYENGKYKEDSSTHFAKSAERQAWREEKIDTHLATVPPAEPENRVLAYTAGGPGSGKTKTFEREFADVRPHLLTVSADDNKLLHPEYRREMDKRDAGEPYEKKIAVYVHEEASSMAKAMLHEAINRGIPVVYDSTGKNLELMEQANETARNHGYQTSYIYTDADVPLAFRLAKERAARSGREIEANSAEEMAAGHVGPAKAALRMLGEAPRVDEVLVYANDRYGKPARLIATRTGAAEPVILDREAFTNLEKKANITLEEVQRAKPQGPDAGAQEPEAPGRGGVPPLAPGRPGPRGPEDEAADRGRAPEAARPPGAEAPPEALAPPTPPETPPTPEPTEARAKQPLSVRGLMATLREETRAGREIPNTPVALEKWISERFEGYDTDTVYDALEGVTAREFMERAHGHTLTEDLALAEEIENKLAAFKRPRGPKDFEEQKFSTPLPIAVLGAHLAGVREGELVMEPTAGTGNLVAALAGVRPGFTPIMGEYNAVRADVLRELFPNGEVDQGSYFLRPRNSRGVLLDADGNEVRPQVIYTNPPWISLGGKKAKLSPLYWSPAAQATLPFRPIDAAERFLFHNLTELADGGRLVAVLPERIANSRSFLDWLKDNHTVRALLTMPEGSYETRATRVGSTLLVVDKGKIPDAPEPIERNLTNMYDAADIVEALGPGGSHARPETEASGGKTLTAPVAPERPAAPVPPTAVAPGERTEPTPEGPVAGTGGATGTAGPGPGRPGRPSGGDELEPAGGGVDTGLVLGRGAGSAQPGQAAPPESIRTRRMVSRTPEPEYRKRFTAVRATDYLAALRSRIFTPFTAVGKGRNTPHPRQLVESRAQASVPFPELTTELHPDLLRFNKEGTFTDESYESVARVHQATNKGHGMLVADGTGIGKSRQIGALDYEWHKSGTRRSLILTAKETNITDLHDEFRMLVGRMNDDLTVNEDVPDYPVELIKLRDYKIPKGQTDLPDFPIRDGAYFVEYGNIAKYLPLLKRIFNVDGKEMALIADEIHLMRNLDSAQGAAYNELNQHLINGHKVKRIGYFTASPGVQLEELTYLYGLKLWKPTVKSFNNWLLRISGRAKAADAQTFLADQKVRLEQQLAATNVWEVDKRAALQAKLDGVEHQLAAAVGKDGGEGESEKGEEFQIRTNPFDPTFSSAELEQIMRELKTTGRYMSRELWHGGTKVEGTTLNIPQADWDEYEQVRDYARRLDITFRNFGAFNHSNKGAKRYGIRGSLQAELKRRLAYYRLKNALPLIKEAIHNGENVVISLINVNPSKDEGGDLGKALGLINTKDVQVDDDGVITSSTDMPELERHVLLLREEMMDLPKIPDPIKFIEDELGRDNVVSLTGRTPPGQRKTLRLRFQANKGRALIISDASKVGISAHHKTLANLEKPPKGWEAKNDTGLYLDEDGNPLPKEKIPWAGGQRRMFYMDYDWSVIKTLQGVGRVDRTGQITSPLINFMLTGQAAERKIVATAASRLQATGAVSRGAGEASGIDPLSEFDMSGTLALTAMRRVWTRLPRETKQYFIGNKFKDATARDPHAPAQDAPPSLTTTADMKDFLLEAMLLPREVGNKVLGEVIEEMDRVLEFGGDVTKENYKDLPDETKQALAKEAREMGMDVGDILSLRAAEHAAKTERADGEILQDVHLSENTALAVVKDASGKKYGVLYGVFSEEMNAVLDAIGYDRSGEIPIPPTRHYVSFDAGEGNQVTGLKIKPSALDRVAKVFGGQVGVEKVTPETAVEALKLGDEIAVRAQDWSVKRRRDGRNEIHGLKFKDRLDPAFDKLLTGLGVKYDATRKFHFVEDAKVAEFLTEFGIKAKAVEQTADADVGEIPEDARVGDVQHYNPRAANYQAPAPNSPQAAEVTGLNEVIDNLAEATNAVIRSGRFREPGKPTAIFKKTPEVLRFKPTTSLAGKFAAVTHEIGHLIEKRLFGKGLSRTRGVDHDTRLFKAKFGPELMQLAQTQKVPTLSEGLAEFVRRYVQDDAALRQDAPKLYAFLDRRLADVLPDMHEGLTSARKDFETYMAGGPDARMWSAISTEPKKANARTFDKLWTAMTDDLHPIKAIVDDVTGKKKLADGDNPEVIHRVLRGWLGKVDSFLKWGTLKFNGLDRVGKPLKEIFEPIWSQRKEFTLYMAALRDAEYRRAGMELPWTEADAQAVVLKHGANPAFRKAATEYRAYREALLDYIRDAGMLDDAQLKSLRELGENHIPFYRVVEGVDPGRTYALPGETANIFHPIRRKKGGSSQIIDPLESAFKNTYVLINAAERNAAGLSLVKFLKGTEGYGKYLEEVPVRVVPRKIKVEEVLDKAGLSHRLSEAQVDTVTIFRPDLYETEPNTVTIWERGKQKHYRVHPDLYRAMMGADREVSNTWFRILGKFAHVLRVGATTTLAFGVKNPLRDQFSGYINRKYKSNIPGLDFMRFFTGANLVEGMYHAARQDKAYQDAAVAGAFYSEMVSMDRNYMGGGLRDLMKTRMQKMNPLTVLAHPIQHLQALSALGEQATRLMEVKRGLAVEGRTRRGATAAGYSGREVTLDFQRIGASVYSLNQINAFFNAGIQGLAKIGRQAKSDPVGFGARVTASITIPSILLYLANRNDPRYQALDDGEKDLFWHILTPDNIYRIPKPFELGIWFGSFPERVMRYMESKDPEAFDAWASTMLRSVPNPLAVTAVVPLAEAWANKSFFYNRKIVPSGMEKLEPAEQYQPYTPQVYREVGKATNTSPLMLEHLWSGYTGGLGRDVGQLASVAGEKVGAFPQEALPQRSLMQMMGLESRFPGGSLKPAERLYDALGQAETADTTLRHFASTGQQARVDPYLAQHPEVQRLGGLKKATAYLAELRRQRSEVLADRTLTRAQKEDKVRLIDGAMLSFAQERQRDLLAQP